MKTSTHSACGATRYGAAARPLFLLLHLALLSPGPAPVLSLPFRTRGGQQKDDPDEPDSSTSTTTSSDGQTTVTVDASALGGGGGGGGGYPTVVSELTSSDPADRRDAAVETFFASSSSSSASANLEATTGIRDAIRTRASALSPFLSETRRLLHQHPELMYNEATTSAIVRGVLTDLGIEHSTGWAKNAHPDVHPGPGGYGVVADIGTGREPCVLIRADMDALPILERTVTEDGVFLPYRSRNDGAMHACGHDGHTTMLLGAAAILRDVEGSINGTVRIVFQPAEEGGAGAKRMREEGVLDRPPRPAHAFGMHVWQMVERDHVVALCLKIKGKYDPKWKYFWLYEQPNMREFCPVRHLLCFIYLAGIKGGNLFPTEAELGKGPPPDGVYKTKMSADCLREVFNGLFHSILQTDQKIGLHTFRVTAYLFAKVKTLTNGNKDW